MFGFITINRKALDDAEYSRYLQAYCGQCHTLGTRLGQHCRMALSHDMTFMALLLQSLYEPAEAPATTGCFIHPLTERTWISSPCIDYAADMTVALMYHKLADDAADDHSTLAAIGKRSLQRAYDEVAARCPRQCGAIEAGLTRIAQVERDDGGNPDTAANVFGAIMGEIFCWQEDYWACDLRLFGARLGRFIYLMDAAVDLQKDRNSGSYNPFAKSELTADDIKSLLMAHMQGVTDIFERLPLEQDLHLLRNVLYSGVWCTYNYVMEQAEKPADPLDCEAESADSHGQPADAAYDEVGEQAEEPAESANCDMQPDNPDERPADHTDREAKEQAEKPADPVDCKAESDNPDERPDHDQKPV